MIARPRLRWVRRGPAANCSSLGNVVEVITWSTLAAGAAWAAWEAAVAARRGRHPGGGRLRLDAPPAVAQVGPEEEERPVEVHLQASRRCPLPCPGCHVDPAPDGPEAPTALLEARLAELAARGVAYVALGGGEVALRGDLPRLAAAARRHGILLGATTSGLLPVAEPDRFAGFAQVNVSLDGLGSTYRRARGVDGARRALAAIRRMSERGIRVGINLVLDRFTWPEARATVAVAVAAGARAVQLLRLKPAGRLDAAWRERTPAPEQARGLWRLVEDLAEAHPGVEIRVDCALVPFLATEAMDRDPALLDRMARHAVWGCHGAGHLLAVEADGAERPCSFVPGPVDAALRARWRQGPRVEPCRSCPALDLCRGGCHAVAAHVTGDPLAPDPECPRVRAHAARRAPRGAASSPGAPAAAEFAP